jgi:hypothetical protein
MIKEIIDAEDPRGNASDNDVLTDMVNTLRTMETKLMSMIGNLNDEEMMNMTLRLNDDLQKANITTYI